MLVLFFSSRPFLLLALPRIENNISFILLQRHCQKDYIFAAHRNSFFLSLSSCVSICVLRATINKPFVCANENSKRNNKNAIRYVLIGFIFVLLSKWKQTKCENLWEILVDISLVKFIVVHRIDLRRE